MKRFCIYSQPVIPPKRFDIFPPDWRMLRRSRRVLKSTFVYYYNDLIVLHPLGIFFFLVRPYNYYYYCSPELLDR